MGKLKKKTNKVNVKKALLGFGLILAGVLLIGVVIVATGSTAAVLAGAGVTAI